jgi:hypothetical protein
MIIDLALSPANISRRYIAAAGAGGPAQRCPRLAH